jgi:hypothetical protein
MFSEVGLFILALSLFILMFAAAVSVVKHDTDDFAGIPPASLALFKMFMRMYIISDYAQFREEPVVLVCISIFLLSTTVFLLNLLIAQLTCAYTSVYVDMVGFARLQRIEIIVNTIPTVSSTRWSSFIMSLRLNHKLEFNEGDIGLAGGIQTFEPASANPTTIDQIKRFGGSTSREMPWPEEDDGDENDKFDRLEALIQKTMKRLAKGGKAGKKGGGSSAGGGTGSGLGSGSGAGGDDAGSGGSQMSSGGSGGGGRED